MSTFFEGRRSDSPYIDIIWRGRVEQDYAPVCPADANWNLLFTSYNGQVTVSVEGATSQFVPKVQHEGAEFLVIKFDLGVYMPHLPAGNFVNDDAVLPDASSRSFWLKGSAWQFPDFDNVETFVERLVRHNVLIVEPVVNATMQAQPQDVSARTVRRRFLHTTGLTPKTIQQIKRAQQASALLGLGSSILDTTYELGYADQAHMTRSLKRFIGQTPTQIMIANQVE